MAGITLTDAQTALANWIAADVAVSKGQAFSLSGRSFTRADAEEITKKIVFWEGMVKKLSRSNNGKLKSWTAIPL